MEFYFSTNNLCKDVVVSMPHPLPKNRHFCTDCRGFCKLLVELGWVDPSDSRCVLCLWTCFSVLITANFHLSPCCLPLVHFTALVASCCLLWVSELESLSCLAMPRSLLTLQLVLVSGGSTGLNCNLYQFAFQSPEFFTCFFFLFLLFLSFPSDTGPLLAAAYGA